MRLDSESRRMRFSGTVSDKFIENYGETAFRINTVIHGYFEDDLLRAAAELRPISDIWPIQAEAAFSVEKQWQNTGIGTALMDRTLLSARNRAIKTLYMVCLADNSRMRSIARKHDAKLHFEPGAITADLEPSWPSYFSMLEETMEDGNGFVTAILERAS
ncbi:MAG: GNAT family N-acetyltransferase [Rhizobiales bacterium]|nr:GNAT family N-acetyltransferase [Hyphomicrobiales bacterium]